MLLYILNDYIHVYIVQSSYTWKYPILFVLVLFKIFYMVICVMLYRLVAFHFTGKILSFITLEVINWAILYYRASWNHGISKKFFTIDSLLRSESRVKINDFDFFNLNSLCCFKRSQIKWQNTVCLLWRNESCLTSAYNVVYTFKINEYML